MGDSSGRGFRRGHGSAGHAAGILARVATGVLVSVLTRRASSAAADLSHAPAARAEPRFSQALAYSSSALMSKIVNGSIAGRAARCV